jgi:hypothetical protein
MARGRGRPRPPRAGRALPGHRARPGAGRRRARARLGDRLLLIGCVPACIPGVPDRQGDPTSMSSPASRHPSGRLETRLPGTDGGLALKYQGLPSAQKA